MRGTIYLLIALLVVNTVFAINFTGQNETEIPDPVCGNDKRELGEECDPPEENCYTASFEEGFCTDECKCIAFGRHAICGNDIKEPEEECEKDIHCKNNEICDDCSCITITKTENITESNTTLGLNTTLNLITQINETIELEIEEPEVQPLITEEDLEKEDFDDSIGIKITSGITKIAKALFGWLVKLVW